MTHVAEGLKATTITQVCASMQGRTDPTLTLADAALEVIGSRNDTIRAYLQVASRSQLRDDATGPQRGGPLAGIPICVKDVIDVAGMRTTAGSATWSRVPARDALAVTRLRRGGALVLGKGNTNEFAYGVDGTNPHTGDCRNPHDVGRISGGSSSGPAAAVASGMALAGVGTGTSGSIRIPASLCGLVGLRTTTGAIPTSGVVPLAPSYDALGVMAKTVEDAWLLWDILSSRAAHRTRRHQPGDVRGMRVGVTEELFALADQAVGTGLELALRRLEQQGAKLTSTPRVNGAEARRAHTTILDYEAARVHRGWPLAQRLNYGRPLREFLDAAQHVTRQQYDGAKEARRRIAHQLEVAHAGADALAAPTTPVTAPARAALPPGGGGSVRDRLLSCTVPLTQAPGPVLSVPVGTDRGLPFGLQLAGVQPGTEELVLRLGQACERPPARRRGAAHSS